MKDRTPKVPKPPKGYELITKGIVRPGDVLVNMSGGWSTAGAFCADGCPVAIFDAVARKVSRPSRAGKRR